MNKRILSGEEARKNVSPEKNNEYALKLKKMIDCKTVFTRDGENKSEYENSLQ